MAIYLGLNYCTSTLVTHMLVCLLLIQSVVLFSNHYSLFICRFLFLGCRCITTRTRNKWCLERSKGINHIHLLLKWVVRVTLINDGRACDTSTGSTLLSWDKIHWCSFVSTGIMRGVSSHDESSLTHLGIPYSLTDTNTFSSSRNSDE